VGSRGWLLYAISWRGSPVVLRPRFLRVLILRWSI